MKKYLSFFIVVLLLFATRVNATTKAPVDITTMSISDLGSALDKGYLTSETLVKLYLERIEAYNDQFNAINQLNEHALEQAKELDKERASGNVKSALHGIPILVKCNIDVYGMPTTAGTKALLDNYPKENAYAVQKLIDAGAIILGSTNMSELAFSARDSYSSYGYVRNVFNSEYTSYGSSGGAAVSVKAIFAAASLGTDTNSSVRIPASGAGVVGLRPTFGLISRSGVIPYDVNRDTIGILTQTVSDNALILSVISGSDSNDSVTKNIPSFTIKSGDTSLKGINIGVPTQYLKGSGNNGSVTSETDPDIYNLAVAAIAKLESQGANIIYLDDFVKSSNLTIASQTQAGITMCDGFNNYIKGTTGTIRSFQQLVTSPGHVQLLSGYVGACGEGDLSEASKIAKKATYREYVENYIEENNLDVIIYPTLKNKPGKYNAGVANISPGSSLGSVIGFPSITVPMGYDNDGFAYGLEFLTNALNEEMLYNVTMEFEKANGNIVSPSTLTPALYTVPDEVNELIANYEKVLSLNSDNDKIVNWLDSVRAYFTNYNNYEDVVSAANDLLTSYEEENIEDIITNNNIFSNFNKKNLTKVMVYAIFGIVTGIILVRFFKEFFQID